MIPQIDLTPDPSDTLAVEISETIHKLSSMSGQEIFSSYQMGTESPGGNTPVPAGRMDYQTRKETSPEGIHKEKSRTFPGDIHGKLRQHIPDRDSVYRGCKHPGCAHQHVRSSSGRRRPGCRHGTERYTAELCGRSDAAAVHCRTLRAE